MNRMTLAEVVGLVAMIVLFNVARQAAADEAEVTRVATLLPFVEEALSLAPENAVVVASVRRSMHHPLSENLVDLGNPHSPNFEKLSEARPQLIVGDQGVHGALKSKLEALGAKVVLLDTSGIDETLASLSTLSASLGDTPQLDGRIDDVRATIAASKLGKPVKVLPLFGAPGTFYAMTHRAWLGELVSALGFENLAPQGGDERFPGLAAVSDEIISTLEPDIVFLVAHGDPRKIRADLQQRTLDGGAWSSLRSARLGIHVLDPSLFAANPGLDLDRAAAQLISLAETGSTGEAPGHPHAVSSGPSQAGAAHP